MGNALNFIFPNVCKFCGKAIAYDQEVCAPCENSIEPINGITCSVCGKEQGFCRCEAIDFEFERCIAPFYYEGTAKKGINTLKYGGVPYVAKYLARYIGRLVKKQYKDVVFDYACCVPMHRLKQLERGYNQSEMLLRWICRSLSIIPSKHLLVQVKKNESQHRKHRKERAENVKGIYKVQDKLNLTDKTILLVDDIFTTGATLNECTRMLKAAGAANVYCAVFCTTKPIKLEKQKNN